MRTFTCLAALFLLAAAVSAAPFNEDDWGEETVGTDTALTLFDTAGTAGIPEVFLSQDQPWIRPFAMDRSRKWLSMTEEEKDAFAEQHARNAIAAARARGDMVLSDADVELMLPTVKEACKMVGEVLWNNAADIITGVASYLVNKVLGIDDEAMNKGLAAVTAVAACSNGLVKATDVPEIDGKKTFKNAKGAMVACTLSAVQANIQLMIGFFCDTIAKPWLDYLIPTVMPTPANAATWLVWLTGQGQKAIIGAVCPALQFAVCWAKAELNKMIKKLDQKNPAVKTMGTIFDTLEVFLCAVSPGNVAGKDQAAAESKKYQAALNNARMLNKFHAATGAKWDAAKKQFNCGGKPCVVKCTGACGPMFGPKLAKGGSGQPPKPGSRL